MRKYKLDYDKSKEIYKSCKSHIKIKECYNNIFNVVTDYISNFRSNKWKVAYGYTEVMPLLYCRHCFIIDENKNVIDPTICTNANPNINREYITIKIFDDIDEYFTAIERENYMPALDYYLKENAKTTQNKANKKGYILID